MKFYHDYLIQKGYLHIAYIPYHEVDTFYKSRKIKNLKISCFDPFDFDMEDKLMKYGFNVNYIRTTPMFLADAPILSSFHDTHGKKKNISHAVFYKYLKSKLNVLDNTPSYDTENRNPLPKGIKLPDQPTYNSSYVKEAIQYIDTHPKFSKNHGKTENVIYYPCTFQQIRNHFAKFLAHKLRHFGDYQDAIDGQGVYLFHAVISCVLNNGMLTPKYVVQNTLKYVEQNKGININNVEGFLRQVLGWREYMRYLYQYHYQELIVSNHWNATYRIKDWAIWYKGQTGIETLDLEIQKCVEYAYSHHIIRLMVFLNIFVLCGIHPHDIVKWFMDVCSIDAYPWVMWSNIIAMGWFSPRFMKKPYISTENYIIKMSGKKKSPCPIWSALFYHFLSRNRKYLTGTSRIYLRNLSAIDRKENSAFVMEKYNDVVAHFTKKNL
jgi:deoxyribodipyrimidine photolyase-related protein